MTTVRTPGEGKRRPSILHVVSYFPPDRIGGVGEVVAHVHRALLRRGHKSVVLTSGIKSADPTVRRIGRTPAQFVLRSWKCVALAREADVIHLHHGEGLLLILLLKLLRSTAPVVLTLHVSLASMRPSLRPYKIAGRVVGRRGLRGFLERTVRLSIRQWFDTCAIAIADELSFISRSAAVDVLPPAQAKTARVIYNGVPATDLLDYAPEPVDLLFVGTGGVRKRIHVLPFVLAYVRERRPGCRMRVIGFLPENEPEFLSLARELGVVDAFIFEGRMRSEQLPAYYRAAQVLIVPSAYEGLPMVILEAYQNGLPCVATRVSGHPEVVQDGYNGYLVGLDRPREMAEAALRLLEQPSLARQMGERGKERVAMHFAVERQVRAYVELYGHVWEQNDRRGAGSTGSD